MRRGWIAALPLALIALASCTSDDSEVKTEPSLVTHTTATLKTSMGTIVVALDGDKAPQSVTNFVGYAQAGGYDGTIFHRVIPGFMIQGGGFDENMDKRITRAPVKNESDNGVSNTRGSIAMARTPDPHSATNQFFINLIDNAFLDHGAQGANSWGYAVFGEVVEGLEVVDKIENVATTQVGSYSDVPKTPILIISVLIEPPKE